MAQVKNSSALCRTRTWYICSTWWPSDGLQVPRTVDSLDRSFSHHSVFDQWQGFLSAVVTAHEADLLYMRNFLEEITKNKCNQGGLTLKDLKPDTFKSK